jgi:hypothetical protein
MLSWFHSQPHSHLRRAAELLREAHMARIEHQAAAEHHEALADMYAQRAERLEREIHAAQLSAAGLDAPSAPGPLEEVNPPTLYTLERRRRTELPAARP